MEFAGSNQGLSWRSFALCLVSMLMLSGCGDPPVDHKAVQDFQVEKEWLKQFDSTPAVAHLEGGGTIADFEDEAPVDQSVLLPLLKSLEKKHSLEFLNLKTKEDGDHYALVAKIPDGLDVRNAIRDEINEVNERFGGMVIHSWGHRWISLDVIGAEELEVIKDAGALDAIKEELALPEG